MEIKGKLVVIPESLQISFRFMILFKTINPLRLINNSHYLNQILKLIVIGKVTRQEEGGHFRQSNN